MHTIQDAYLGRPRTKRLKNAIIHELRLKNAITHELRLCHRMLKESIYSDNLRKLLKHLQGHESQNVDSLGVGLETRKFGGVPHSAPHAQLL